MSLFKYKPYTCDRDYYKDSGRSLIGYVIVIAIILIYSEVISTVYGSSESSNKIEVTYYEPRETY